MEQIGELLLTVSLAAFKWGFPKNYGYHVGAAQ